MGKRRWGVVEGSRHGVMEGFGEIERQNESMREQYNKRCSGDRKGMLRVEKLHSRKKKGRQQECGERDSDRGGD